MDPARTYIAGQSWVEFRSEYHLPLRRSRAFGEYKVFISCPGLVHLGGGNFPAFSSFLTLYPKY